MCRKKGRAKNVVAGHLNEQKGPLGYQKLHLVAGELKEKYWVESLTRLAGKPEDFKEILS